jgi:hypothetical protein
MPCKRTAVGGSGIDLSIAELHLTCRSNLFAYIIPYSKMNQIILRVSNSTLLHNSYSHIFFKPETLNAHGKRKGK